MVFNRVAVVDVSRTMTQGSSCLANLGSGTESRLGFWNGARLCESQQVRQHGDGWMFPPQHCMRKCCGSLTSQSCASFLAISRLVGVSGIRPSSRIKSCLDP